MDAKAPSPIIRSWASGYFSAIFENARIAYFNPFFFSEYAVCQYDGLFGCVICSEGDFSEIYAQVLYDYPVGRASKCDELFAHERSFNEEEIAFGKEPFVSFLPFFLPGQCRYVQAVKGGDEGDVCALFCGETSVSLLSKMRVDEGGVVFAQPVFIASVRAAYFANEAQNCSANGRDIFG